MYADAYGVGGNESEASGFLVGLSRRLAVYPESPEHIDRSNWKITADGPVSEVKRDDTVLEPITDCKITEEDSNLNLERNNTVLKSIYQSPVSPKTVDRSKWKITEGMPPPCEVGNPVLDLVPKAKVRSRTRSLARRRPPALI